MPPYSRARRQGLGPSGLRARAVPFGSWHCRGAERCGRPSAQSTTAGDDADPAGVPRSAQLSRVPRRFGMCDAGASGPRSPLIAGSARPLLNPEPNRLGARREPAQPLRADPDVKNELIDSPIRVSCPCPVVVRVSGARSRSSLRDRSLPGPPWSTFRPALTQRSRHVSSTEGASNHAIALAPSMTLVACNAASRSILSYRSAALAIVAMHK